MLSAVKPTIIMLILGKINQISVCLAVALRLKLIWKKIVINHLVNSPFKVEVVSVLHPEVQVTKKIYIYRYDVILSLSSISVCVSESESRRLLMSAILTNLHTAPQSEFITQPTIMESGKPADSQREPTA